DDWLNPNIVVSVGDWHHLVATFDGTTKALYLDGVQVDSRTVASPLAYENVPLLIGEDTNNNGPAGLKFNGLIDEASIYGRALSIGEIQSIYNAGSDGKASTGAYGKTVTIRVTDGTATDSVHQWKAQDNTVDNKTGAAGTLSGGATFAPGLVGQAFSF